MTNTYKNIASLLFIIFLFCNNTYSNNSTQDFEKLKKFEKVEKFEKVVITSDSFVLDYQKGYAVYSKNVDLSQVNKKLHADNLCFYFDKKQLPISNKASGQLRLITAFNNSRTPVIYTETHVNRPIKAMADMIKFDPISNKVIFEKNAFIEQNNKILSSELVYYDLKKEIVYMPKINKQRSKLLLGAL